MIVINNYRGISLHNQWVEKVINQLNRDLYLTGFDKEFNTGLNFIQFQNECITYFESLLKINDQQVYNLLYRIDIDQKKIHNHNKKPQIHLTQLVIEREFQKVVLKNEFSNDL